MKIPGEDIITAHEDTMRRRREFSAEVAAACAWLEAFEETGYHSQPFVPDPVGPSGWRMSWHYHQAVGPGKSATISVDIVPVLYNEDPTWHYQAIARIYGKPGEVIAECVDTRSTCRDAIRFSIRNMKKEGDER